MRPRRRRGRDRVGIGCAAGASRRPGRGGVTMESDERWQVDALYPDARTEREDGATCPLLGTTQGPELDGEATASLVAARSVLVR